MAEPKTQRHDGSVDAYVASIDNDIRRGDAERLLPIFAAATGDKPVMWGPSIIGYGEYELTYADGRTANWMRVGFSPRKASTTLYLLDGFDSNQDDLAQLGKHKIGKACLYVTRLDQVDEKVLTRIIRNSYRSKDK